MIRALILLVALAVPPKGAHWPVAGGGYVLSTGYPLGMLGLNVCTQVADDTTPDMIGAAAGGCNILETSPSHAGAVAITDLDNPLVGAIVWIVGADGAGASTTIADAGNFNLETTWTGTTDNLLELYVQADNDYVEVTRHNGVRYFDGLVTAAAGVDFVGNDAKNLDDLYGDAVATDAAPRVTVLGTQPIFVEPAATNVTGATLVLAPSPGERTLDDVTLAATTGDTLTFDVYSKGVVTQTVKTEGVDWDCDGAGTDIICVCNLWDDLVANPITGVVVTRTDGTCSDEKLTFTIDPGVSEYLKVTTSDDTNLDMTIGTDGQILLSGSDSNTTPMLAASWDPNTGISWRSAAPDFLEFTTAGTRRGYFSTSSFVTSVPITIGAGDYFSFSGLTELRAPADNQLQICNALENQCFTLGASAADTMTLWDKAGTGAATLQLQTSGLLQFGSANYEFSNNGAGYILLDTVYGLNIYQNSDNPTDGNAMLLIDSSATAEMTADGNGEVQYALHVTPELAMTNASAFYGIAHTPTITSQGTGQNLHQYMDWSKDGVAEFKLQADGDLILHENPGSDTAPLDGKIFGANAWAQATGANRNGADLNKAAGIRTLQIVCSDRTLTDTDVITFWIDGVAHTLTESTDFDCFGEASEDACCLEIAAALVTADIGLTPDAVTTAGTIYVTPDEDLLSVDIEYTDGGVNDVGWTLTEGETGEINFYGSVNVYDDAGDGAYWREFHTPANKTQPAAAGPTATFLNTATFVYLLDANTEYLYFGMDVHDDWDGSSDLVVEVQVALSGGETANDILNAEIVVEYVGDHEDIDTGIRTQTRTINHDIVSDNGQGDVHHLVFIIDEDLGSHEVAVDDNVSFRFRLDVAGGAGQVAAVWYMGANVKYRTSKPQLETGGSFPTEG